MLGILLEAILNVTLGLLTSAHSCSDSPCVPPQLATIKHQSSVSSDPQQMLDGFVWGGLQNGCVMVQQALGLFYTHD